MDNSIENIWKNGFTNETVYIPKIKDLDSLKSIYFVDQFKRRYQFNISILLLTAILVLFAFIIGGIPFIGLFMFTLFASLGILGKVEINKLNHLNSGDSSYDYIKAFDNWLKNLLLKFSFIYKIWIPLFFVGFALALLYTNFFIPFTGERLIKTLIGNSNASLLFGLPIYLIVGLLSTAIILSSLSDYFFKREIKSMYGDLIQKLDQLLNELNQLR